MKPAEKLQPIIEDGAKGKRKDIKQISYSQTTNIVITDFKKDGVNPKVYVYPEIYVAENHYVFVSFQRPNEPVAKYVFEVKPDGKISRSCRME